MFFGNIMFAFSGPAVDHGNLMGFRIPTNATAEAARQAHQVGVVQSLIGTGQVPPPDAETGGIVAHPEVAIQHDPVDAIITSREEVLITVAQPVFHSKHAPFHSPDPTPCRARSFSVFLCGLGVFARDYTGPQ